MLRLFDSLEKEKRIFVPINPNNVRMYVCGPTVYDYAHLGNARPVIVFDVLYRILKYLYKNVVYVRNITDIDDKIIKRANEENIDIKELTYKTEKAFQEDMHQLGTLKPDFQPKATEHVKGMIKMIEGLIKKGFAYESKQHVLFRVKNFKDYGKLSKFSLQQLEYGARIEVAPYKEDPKDFILWKPSKEKEPGWDSPWSFGRPGWHIECSIMSSAYLGKTFDIHGGGIDLIFPHHENEIAQSCAFHSTPKMSNFWMHNGHLSINNQKMSKSLGNFIIIRELLKKYDGEIIRYAFLNTHYRQPLDFSLDILEKAKNNLDKFYRAIRDYENVDTDSNLDEDFLDAIEDDLNTPLALSVLHEKANEINKTKDAKLIAQFKKSCEILGICQKSIKSWFFKNEDISNIEDLINQRKIAKENKDFKKADEIRKNLSLMGIELEDTKSGTRWRKSI